MKLLKFLLPACLLFFAGCKEENPLDIEQYEKSVYLVGANQSNNEGLITVDVPFTESDDGEYETYVSVATGGSQNINKDITVTLADAGEEVISRYNFLYRYQDTVIKYQYLNTDYFSIPSYTTTIKAGEVYGNVPVYFKPNQLHCDSLYAITLKIASVSDPDYIKIRSTDTTLMVALNLVNDYSGTYLETGAYYPVASASPSSSDTVSLTPSRTFTAVSYDEVRFYHLANTEGVLSTLDALGVVVKINSDYSLTISPWGSLSITDGGGTYSPDTETFNIWYTYLVNGVAYKFEGTFVE
ncbi:MAG: DUF1735 domain-containing protein [Niabella sp.]